MMILSIKINKMINAEGTCLSFCIATDLIENLLSSTFQKAWENQTLKFLKPYLIESLIKIVPNLIAPDHADSPAEQFIGCNIEAIEPVRNQFCIKLQLNSGLDIFSQEKIMKSHTQNKLQKHADFEQQRVERQLAEEATTEQINNTSLLIKKHISKIIRQKVDEQTRKSSTHEDSLVGVLQQLQQVKTRTTFDETIDQVRERKLRDLESKAIKEKERQELLRIQQLARQQAYNSSQGQGASINLVTEEMSKRVKIDKLPILIENNTQSIVVQNRSKKALKSRVVHHEGESAYVVTDQHLTSMVPKQDEDNLQLIDEGSDAMFKNLHPSNGVTIKEMIIPRSQQSDHDQRVSFGLVKQGNEYGMSASSHVKRMSRSQYNLLRNKSLITQRKGNTTSIQVQDQQKTEISMDTTIQGNNDFEKSQIKSFRIKRSVIKNISSLPKVVPVTQTNGKIVQQKDTSSVTWNNEFEAATLFSDTPYASFLGLNAPRRIGYNESIPSRPATSCKLGTSFYNNDSSRNSALHLRPSTNNILNENRPQSRFETQTSPLRPHFIDRIIDHRSSSALREQTQQLERPIKNRQQTPGQFQLARKALQSANKSKANLTTTAADSESAYQLQPSNQHNVFIRRVPGSRQLRSRGTAQMGQTFF
ncbi:hypothetical protein FGO68_gene9100 [Halteria grandinella]|uniref:Uncharacterized protein n=1 Tax=Halteria grandinella TaxID=5974 RepID=A0A8J8NVZ8_HALGN|nr:hypothetical protein FGO68_gene9100 [Halteria grandinella]